MAPCRPTTKLHVFLLLLSDSAFLNLPDSISRLRGIRLTRNHYVSKWETDEKIAQPLWDSRIKSDL